MRPGTTLALFVTAVSLTACKDQDREEIRLACYEDAVRSAEAAWQSAQLRELCDRRVDLIPWNDIDEERYQALLERRRQLHEQSQGEVRDAAATAVEEAAEAALESMDEAGEYDDVYGDEFLNSLVRDVEPEPVE